MRPSLIMLVSLLVGACVPTPPAAPAPRTGIPVNASFGRTWDATIDAFAERGISIETLDRSSGLIVPAGRAYAPGRDAAETLSYADCGKSGFGIPVQPRAVKYNVVVRGDSARSTVLVRAFYTTGEVLANCVSKGRFESEAEANIREKAEGVRREASSSSTRCGTGSRAARSGNDWVVTLEHTADGTCQSIPCVIPGQSNRGTAADAIALCEADHSLWRPRTP